MQAAALGTSKAKGNKNLEVNLCRQGRKAMGQIYQGLSGPGGLGIAAENEMSPFVFALRTNGGMR